MKFAVIGDLPQAMFLLKAAHSLSDHELAASWVHGPLESAIASDGLPVSLRAAPEEVIVTDDLDCVIVAESSGEQSINWCRQCSQAGSHVIVVPPDDCTTAFTYEIHLLLDESEKGILPLCGRWLLNVSNDDRMNGFPSSDQIRQLKLDLLHPDDEADRIRRQCEGIDLLCSLGFRYDQVTGLNLAGASGEIVTQSISLAASEKSGESLPPSTLAFQQGSSETGLLKVLLVDQSEVCLPTALPLLADQTQMASGTLNNMALALRSPAECQRMMDEFTNTLEIMTALEKSFRRRRTVDVYFDAISERNVFKTQMTAIGCLILTWATFGLIAHQAIASLFDPPLWFRYCLLLLWIGPITAYLFAQLLLPITRDRSNRESESSPPNDKTSDRSA